MTMPQEKNSIAATRNRTWYILLESFTSKFSYNQLKPQGFDAGLSAATQNLGGHTGGKDGEDGAVDILEDLPDVGDEDDPPVKQGTYAGVLPWVRVVHRNGLHDMPLLLCGCQGQDEVLKDLLAMGLFSATFNNIHTVFILEVLNNFRTTNLDCKTAAHNYYAKLQHQTDPINPSNVPNVCSQLHWVTWQWRHLQNLKQAGYRHTQTMPGPGEVVTFCLACPQPGVNLPESWQEDPNQCAPCHHVHHGKLIVLHRDLYTRFYAIDGNFVADHVALTNSGDIALGKGLGFMPVQKEYTERVHRMAGQGRKHSYSECHGIAG